jgi:hypothetical protein
METTLGTQVQSLQRASLYTLISASAQPFSDSSESIPTRGHPIES